MSKVHRFRTLLCEMTEVSHGHPWLRLLLSHTHQPRGEVLEISQPPRLSVQRSEAVHAPHGHGIEAGYTTEAPHRLLLLPGPVMREANVHSEAGAGREAGGLHGHEVPHRPLVVPGVEFAEAGEPVQ